MKKILLVTIAALGMFTANAQAAFDATNFGSNWSVGVDGGVTTPLKNHPFFKDMRGAFGLHIQKQISPVFALGVEGAAGVNTSSWNTLNTTLIANGEQVTLRSKSRTAIDNMYLGVYGSVNIFNLFGGYKCDGRVFDMELTAGAGWGHDFWDHDALPYHYGANDQNYFATKAGVNFNFNVTKHFAISLKPYVAWNMTGTKYNELQVENASAAYSSTRATFNCMLGLTWNIGDGFVCREIRDPKLLADLNDQVNALRAQIADCQAGVTATEAKAAALAAELDACKNRKPEVIKVVDNSVKNIRYVFYRKASSVIAADQLPNVEMIANYLKNHADAKVIVKGYASKDGNYEKNIQLANARAESVKNMLVKKYRIAADRIEASGEGIGEMFKEESWNRVAICTVE